MNNINELDRELWLENYVKYLTDDDTKQIHDGNEDLCKRCIQFVLSVICLKKNNLKKFLTGI